MENWPLSHSMLNGYYNLQALGMEGFNFPQATTTDSNATRSATLSLSGRHQNILADLSICQTLSLPNFPAIWDTKRK